MVGNIDESTRRKASMPRTVFTHAAGAGGVMIGRFDRASCAQRHRFPRRLESFPRVVVNFGSAISIHLAGWPMISRVCRTQAR